MINTSNPNSGPRRVGDVLQNRYKITGVLNISNTSVVYQARDMRFPNVIRYTAVKEMPFPASDYILRDKMLDPFERKANVVAELYHPAIPKIYDYFSIRSHAYVVMEYINGRDLESVIKAMPAPLPLDVVIKWAIELCDALHYLHLCEPEPIIFRDLKPSHIMVDAQGHIRLIDFGIGRAFQMDDQIVNNEKYAPPEQIKGAELMPAADIYALGAVLHRILTDCDLRLPSSNPDTVAQLKIIAQSALQYRPEDRYPSMAVLKNALESLLPSSN